MYNTITGNRAVQSELGTGGGIHAAAYSYPMIGNNIITGNSAVFGGGISGGSYSYPTIVNNQITGNSADYGGGLHFRMISEPILANNTIAGNRAHHQGGGIRGYYATIYLTNTILWDNDAPDGPEIHIGISMLPSSLFISYSDVEGGQTSVSVDAGSTLKWGPGMIDDDPRFSFFKGFDYLLKTGSPCIDAGDPAIEDGLYDRHPLWPSGYPNGPRSDMGSYGGPGNFGWIR